MRIGRYAWVALLLVVGLAALLRDLQVHDRAVRAEALARIRADSLKNATVTFNLHVDSLLLRQYAERTHHDSVLRRLTTPTRRPSLLREAAVVVLVDSVRAHLDSAYTAHLDSAVGGLRSLVAEARQERDHAVAAALFYRAQRDTLHVLLLVSRHQTALALAQLNTALKKPFWDRQAVKLLTYALALKGAADLIGSD